MYETVNRPRRAFTLIELLVVVAIIGLLAAILLPSLSRVRERSRRVACMSNLHQLGVAVLAYRNAFRDHFPPARSMPEPFVVAGVDDPPLYVALRSELPRDSGAYRCPGDAGYVHARCGISYIYNTSLSGRKPEDIWLVRAVGVPIREVPVAYDFDGSTAETAAGPVPIPFFHLRRNLLFADGRVGEFQKQPAPAPPQSPAP